MFRVVPRLESSALFRDLMQDTTKRYIIFFGIFAVLILGLLVIFLFPRGKEKVEPVDLEVWGVYDTTSVWQGFDRFARKISGVKQVQYRVIPYEEYERTLLDELAAGRGPDIFYIHNSWLTKFQDKIAAQPVVTPAEKEKKGSPYFTLREYQDSFVDVAAKDFTKDGTIFAVPFYVDTLALFYNKDIFNSSGVTQPPSDWDEFAKTVQKISKVDAFGNIIVSGAAIGAAENVNRSPDILSLLMMQLGSPMVSSNGTAAVFGREVGYEKPPGGQYFSPGEEALAFYTSFANPSKSFYTWSVAMPYSIDSFYAGQTAMMINYSHHIPTIERKAPYLNFGVAKVPQRQGVAQAEHMSFANYWGLAVSRNSKNAHLAWQVIAAVSQTEAEKSYIEATKRPPARRDLVPEYRTDPKFGVFAEQALIASSWPQPDNNEVDRIFSDMIKDVVSGKRDIYSAVRRAEEEVSLLLRK